MAKSNDAFRTIGEVSDDLDVPKHVLRFWEGKFPQLKPMKRGGGRRFYRPEDLALLRGIKQLLHSAGYTIKGVQRILRESGVEAVKTLAARGTVEKAHALVAEPMTKRPAKRGTSSGMPLSPALRASLSEFARDLDACLALAKGHNIAKAVAKKNRS